MVSKSVLLACMYMAAANGFRPMAPHGRPAFGVRRLMSDAPVEGAPVEAAAEVAVAVDAPSSSAAAPEAPKKDGFAQFEVGQEYSGNVVGAKAFGVFVDIKKGTNVLLPRSQMTRGGFERLKRMADSKSKEPVKLELIGVSAENATLSGKFLSGVASKDVSLLKKGESGESYEATVVGAHDFGLFAELNEFGVEGLVPASKLPDKLPAGTIQASYPVGSTVKVQVDEFKDDGKKLVLSMKLENRAEVGAFSSISAQKWLTGVVQSVSSFGIFVRPAGYENVGLVHMSRIPRDLVYALKKVAPVPAGTNKTDVECLFQEGDVVKVRTHAVSVGARRIELSMLPFKTDDDDEDDYVVEGRDPEGEVRLRLFLRLCLCPAWEAPVLSHIHAPQPVAHLLPRRIASRIGTATSRTSRLLTTRRTPCCGGAARPTSRRAPRRYTRVLLARTPAQVHTHPAFSLTSTCFFVCVFCTRTGRGRGGG